MKTNRYAIIDIESTGGKATTDRITEVGILLVENGKVIDEFTSLVNPERSIPFFITKITGINNKMVEDAPRFYEIAKRLIEITEDAIFVAHNVNFDYNFFKEEFRQLGYDYKRKTLCTVKLSRRAFPGLKSYSLGNLIKHFDIEVVDRHRAMDDARATTIIFQSIIDNHKNHHIIEYLLNHGIAASRLNNGISLDILRSLPEEIGIYYFYNTYGHIIYIGKSINIQGRVMQHYSGKAKKNDKIVVATASISYELMGSELISLVFESIEIKKYQPEINKALKSTAKYFIYQYTDSNGYINLDIGKNNLKNRRNKDILHFLNSKKSAYEFMQQVRGEYQLCDVLTHIDSSKKPCFRHGVKLCNGACISEESSVEYNVRVGEAIDQINKSFDKDMLIIDKGKSDDNFSVILIRDGVFYGFEFLDADILNENSPDEISEMIRHMPDNMQCNGIIKTYLSKHKVHSVIEL